jgi:hypothetical protein
LEQVVLKKAGAENTPNVFIFSDSFEAATIFG